MKKAAVSSIPIAVVLLAVGVMAEAQPTKCRRIGYLVGRDPDTESTRSEGIRLALRELGYLEG